MTLFSDYARLMSRRPRVLLVHGSVAGGGSTWGAQRPLGRRFELVVPDRPGFPPNPPVDRVDFEEHAACIAELLGESSHLVGHSYGGLISLLAAARRPEAVRSLTVIEPPAFGVVRGDPEVDALVETFAEHWRTGPRDPEAFLRRFLELVGADFDPPSPLPPALEQGARTLMVERAPWEAEVPFADLVRAPFPKLVVSGAHSAAFDAVCDVLEERFGAARAVLPGAGHSVQRLGAPFNDVLAAFIARAESHRR